MLSLVLNRFAIRKKKNAKVFFFDIVNTGYTTLQYDVGTVVGELQHVRGLGVAPVELWWGLFVSSRISQTAEVSTAHLSSPAHY